MDKLINELRAIRYNVAYWTIGTEETIKQRLETEYCWGCVHSDTDPSKWICRITTEDDPDSEEWVAIGLTPEELNYIHSMVWMKGGEF